MTYIAQESFRSHGGDRFSYGQEISQFEYNKLMKAEQMKFRRKYSSDDDSYSRRDTDNSVAPGLFGATTYDDTPSHSSHDDTPSFGGWGGGDSGGGGSSDSWGSSDSGGSDGGGGDGGGGD
jgi:uncharacterized membrane protein YgcG